MLKILEVDSIVSNTSISGFDYVINPYTGCTFKCIYCHACFIKKFTDHSKDVWGEFLDVKKWSGYLSNKRKIYNKNILIGSVTDPYVKEEGFLENTKQILEKIQKYNCTPTICTKSDLILRDLDLIKEMKGKIAISLNTLDEDFAQKSEGISVSSRIEALKEIHAKGIYTIVCVSPIFPYITDYKSIVDKTKDYADKFWFENLKLRQPYGKNILNFIKCEYPQYYDQYQKITPEYWDEVAWDIRNYCKDLIYKTDFR